MDLGQACRPCRGSCSLIPGRGCFGNLLGDEIVVSPLSPIVEPLKGRDDVYTMPPNTIRLQLEKDDVLQQSLVIARSTIKWSFGDLTSSNGRIVAKIITGGSFDEVMGC